VPVLRGGSANRERPDAHDWLEVTGLTEPAPVELLEPVEPEPVLVVAPDPLVEELSPLPVSSEPLEPVSPDVDADVLAEPAVTALLLAVRDSAGSCPVTSTTAITAHTTMNSATEYPTTRPRILRTRARRSCLILIASSELMHGRVRRRRSKPVWTG
jgi:hypothetical protein